MKVRQFEIKAKTLAVKLAEWTLLFILGVGSAAVYEAQQSLKADQPVHTQRQV
jgi:hypothetical protein